MRRKFRHFDYMFQLYIELDGSNPKIWRRIQIPIDYTFGQLHQVIQTAFAWEDSHLHLFTLMVLEDYGIDTCQFEPHSKDENMPPLIDSSLDENLHQLSDHLKVGQEFEYEYDFGDDWMHNILVEGYLVRDKKAKCPVCIDGQNHHAFEDIGGIYGYQHAVAVLADPEDAEHKELKAWLKERYGATKINKFDPKAFDPKKIKF